MMGSVRVIVSVLVLIALSAVNVTFAIGSERNRHNHHPVTQAEINFVQELQDAVKRNDCVWISNNVFYPIRVRTTSDGFVQIKTSHGFIDNCNEIISDNVKQAVLGTDLQRIFKSSLGIRLGQGEVWLMSLSRNKDGPFKIYITTINN